MSGHSYYLWDAKQYLSAPNSFAEAVTDFQLLSQKSEDRITERLLTLAQRLQDLVRLHQYQDIESMVALYGNLVQDVRLHQGAVFQIDLPDDPEERLKAQYAIVDTAALCGLVVFDDELGMVFLPTRKIYPPENGKMWLGALSHVLNEKPEFPRTEAQFKKLAAPLVKSIALKYGFQEAEIPYLNGKLGFSRTLPHSTQYISITYDKRYSEFYIQIYIYMDIETVQSIYNKFLKHDDMATLSISSSGLIRHDRLSNENKWCISSHTDLTNVLGQLEECFFQNRMNKLIDIKACDIYFNYSEVGRDTLYDLGVSNYDIPKLAIIARLAGNPRFDELVSQFEQLDDWGAMQGHREVEWPQLLKSLREEVQPIEL
jgi:hypothetical protein